MSKRIESSLKDKELIFITISSDIINEQPTKNTFSMKIYSKFVILMDYIFASETFRTGSH